MRVVYRTDKDLQVFRLGKTSNEKICADRNEKIVQTYTFSKEQFEYVHGGGKSLKEFFSVAEANCMDCPMRDYGKCYTHKFTQASGFMSMLRSIIKEYGSWDGLPTKDESTEAKLEKMSEGRYIRFGTYGEPVLHSLATVKRMVSNAKSWTGYTHQWHKSPGFNEVFMASTHSDKMEQKAKVLGWRSFVSVKGSIDRLVSCPASKEGGYKSSCDKCGLCSGVLGKGKKSVFILEH